MVASQAVLQILYCDQMVVRMSLGYPGSFDNVNRCNTVPKLFLSQQKNYGVPRSFSRWSQMH